MLEVMNSQENERELVSVTHLIPRPIVLKRSSRKKDVLSTNGTEKLICKRYLCTIRIVSFGSLSDLRTITGDNVLMALLNALKIHYAIHETAYLLK